MRGQQEQGFDLSRKDGLNFLCAVAGGHATTLAVFVRRGFGSEALGFRGLAALLLLLVVLCYTRNPVFLDYLGFWLFALICQRLQTMAMLSQGRRLHSRYDGTPVVAMLFTRSESIAKLVVEPVLCLLVAILLSMVADANDMPELNGLAGYIGFGFFSLLFDHGVYEMVQRKRVQAMRDAKLEQEQLMQRFQEERW
jgi:hypothetical protein